LQRLVNRLELADAVRFRGPLEGLDALLAAYRRADVFCLPSRQEGFGIVFLEAMAAGLPIVAARAGATPEVAPEGIASLLVPPDRADLLAAALDRVLADEDLRTRLSEGGRARWRAYDWPEVARRFLAATRLAPGEGPARY
jgi:glycosyltransferase involved in cell wall biosynthesis